MPKPSIKPNKLLAKLATAVRKQRLALDWSQDKLAEESGLTRNFISLIECGEGNPSIVKLAMLAKALDVTLSELLKDI